MIIDLIEKLAFAKGYIVIGHGGEFYVFKISDATMCECPEHVIAFLEKQDDKVPTV